MTNSISEVLTEKQIEKAVNWWANVICKPKFDNGDKSEAGGVCMLLAHANKTTVQENQIKKFKDSLSEQLRKCRYLAYALECDYHPSPMLAQACKDAEISESNVPWKTHMIFKCSTEDIVRVSYGYAAEYKDI